MADFRSTANRILYNEHQDREYTVRDGNIDYLDGSPLARPFRMPTSQRIIALVIVIAAIAIGIVFIQRTVLATIQETALAEQTIESNLTRQASVETIPQMGALIDLDDEEILADFEDSGYTVFDASSTSEGNSLVVYKLPSDMTVDDAAVLLMQGVNSLSATQASRFLNGSWYFAADRVGGTSMVVRYADFSTGDPEIAVQSALAKEGFNTESVIETGIDESGNTYAMGTLETEDSDCTWKVSALPLSEMYSIAGLPEDACYVGVRVTII